MTLVRVVRVVGIGTADDERRDCAYNESCERDFSGTIFSLPHELLRRNDAGFCD